MTKRRIMICVYAVLGLAVGLTFLRGMNLREGRAETDGNEITLSGVVRDFKSDHPDFGVVPTGGTGHAAGLVGQILPANGRPDLGSSARHVTTQWRDADGRPIAPHLANLRPGIRVGETLGIRVSDRIELKKEAAIDAFDSAVGVYGLSGNYGGDAVMTTNATDEKSVRIDERVVVRGDVLVGAGGTPGQVIENKGRITGAQAAQDESFEMPAVEMPDHVETMIEELHLHDEITLIGEAASDDGDADEPAKYYGKIHLHDQSILTISGEVVLRVDGDFKMDKRSEIRLLPEAGLTLCVGGDIDIKDQALINAESGSSSAVTINAVGRGHLKIHKGSHVYATVTAPERKLEIKDEGQLYGAFVGAELKVDGKNSGVHVDRANSMSGPWNFALTVREKIEVEDESLIDGFDSNLGAYGGEGAAANVMDAICIVNGKKKDYFKLKKRSVLQGDLLYGPGGDPHKIVKIEGNCEITGQMLELAEPVAIPVVTPPAMAASVGDVKYESETVVINADMRCKKLKLEKGTTAIIDGDVTIRCEKLEMKESEIRLEPGARLTLYLEKELKMEESSLNMNTGNPQLVSIRRIAMGGKGKIKVSKESRLVAWMQGSRTELEIKDESQVYGSFIGRKVKVKDDSAFHVDMAGLVTCIDPEDVEGKYGGITDGGVDSGDTFRQWFGNALGVTQSKTHTITLERGAEGVYEYLDDAFYPLDGRLYGNEGRPHNYHFTYAIRGYFTPEECGGHFIELEGGDGAWVYVNNRLVIDLGGVRSGVSQRFDLDRLGLEGGREYPIAILYSQRELNDPVFKLRTDLEIDTSRVIPSVTNMYD